MTTEAEYAQSLYVVRSVRGHTYDVRDVETCDRIISLLNEHIHRSTETGRLVSWIPSWQADIDSLLDHRADLAMLPTEGMHTQVT